ncbi:hypothetical protein ON010_g8988 [Phytophthora cinnamomi]|nr:hypothetical protein ON010_g8988 [Phytophthora cinnamomi]
MVEAPLILESADDNVVEATPKKISGTPRAESTTSGTTNGSLSNSLLSTHAASTKPRPTYISKLNASALCTPNKKYWDAFFTTADGALAAVLSDTYSAKFAPAITPQKPGKNVANICLNSFGECSTEFSLKWLMDMPVCLSAFGADRNNTLHATATMTSTKARRNARKEMRICTPYISPARITLARASVTAEGVFVPRQRMALAALDPHHDHGQLTEAQQVEGRADAERKVHHQADQVAQAVTQRLPQRVEEPPASLRHTVTRGRQRGH